MKITILERPSEITARSFNQRLEKALDELKTELKATTTLDGFTSNRWARIGIGGEDSEILAELITNEYGLAHTDLREIEAPGIYESIITRSNAQGLEFDVGLEKPGHVNCSVPASHLIAQLADGKNIQCREIIEDYCLFPGVRLSVRITRKTDNEIEAWLSDSQIEQLSGWITAGLDRIEAFDCYKQEVEAAILKANLSRDIISADQITLTVQSITCKLGTDAIGLIPKLGSVLKRQKLRPFIPKRIVARCRPW
jgi:hypothetical protein